MMWAGCRREISDTSAFFCCRWRGSYETCKPVVDGDCGSIARRNLRQASGSWASTRRRDCRERRRERLSISCSSRSLLPGMGSVKLPKSCAGSRRASRKRLRPRYRPGWSGILQSPLISPVMQQQQQQPSPPSQSSRKPTGASTHGRPTRMLVRPSPWSVLMQSLVSFEINAMGVSAASLSHTQNGFFAGHLVAEEEVSRVPRDSKPKRRSVTLPAIVIQCTNMQKRDLLLDCRSIGGICREAWPAPGPPFTSKGGARAGLAGSRRGCCFAWAAAGEDGHLPPGTST